MVRISHNNCLYYIYIAVNALIFIENNEGYLFTTQAGEIIQISSVCFTFP